MAPKAKNLTARKTTSPEKDSAEKKSKPKQKKSERRAASIPNPLEKLESLTEILAPAQEVLDGLRTRAEEATKRLNALESSLGTSSLGTGSEASGSPVNGDAGAADAKVDKAQHGAEVDPGEDAKGTRGSASVGGSRPNGHAAGISAEEKEQRNIVRIWQSVAAEQLATMASSLDGALNSESKLRELFDSIDLDHGGTIDKDELKVALTSAGKTLSDSQMARMMEAADADANGEIDFAEFGDILRGHIRSNAAAKMIGRSFRKHRNGTRRTSVLADVAVESLSVQQLETMLGVALLNMKGDLKNLVRDWGRHTPGEIGRMEFRRGVREDLGLHRLESKTLDAWFKSIDKDGSGTLDVSELKGALAKLQQRAESERREYQEVSELLDALQFKTRYVEELMRVCTAAVQPAIDARDRFNSFRARPAVDAKVGEKLAGKMAAKGLAERDLASQITPLWDLQPTRPGRVNKDEFVRLVASLLVEAKGASAKAAKSEATTPKLPPSSTPQVTRPVNPLGAGEPAPKKGAAKAPKKVAEAATPAEAAEHSDEKARAERQAAESLLVQAKVRVEDVEALFEAHLGVFAADAAAGAPESLDIGATLGLMVKAYADQQEADEGFVNTCATRKGEVESAKEAVRTAIADFIAREEAEAAAEVVQKANEAKAAAEAKTAASTAKRDAQKAAPTSQLHSWMGSGVGETPPTVSDPAAPALPPEPAAAAPSDLVP